MCIKRVEESNTQLTPFGAVWLNQFMTASLSRHRQKSLEKWCGCSFPWDTPHKLVTGQQQHKQSVRKKALCRTDRTGRSRQNRKEKDRDKDRGSDEMGKQTR
jgi:hypothetical protein